MNAANEPAIRQALQLVRDGIRRQDPGRLGEGATMSALANQRILPKPHLEAIIDYALARGAYGVNVAHSGTVAGILLPPGREAEEPLVRGLRARFPEIEDHYSLRLTGGGPRYPARSGRRGRFALGKHQHGGNVASAAARFGIDPGSSWISASTPTPWGRRPGWSGLLRESSGPGRLHTRSLTAGACAQPPPASTESIPEQVIAANGAVELIYLLVAGPAAPHRTDPRTDLQGV